ncbi:hypothetical protein DFR86_07400 [Acidianus sulfidivorans JP7]|uniref:MFS transporter n=1 Tax=Acidianus sulfidivorans JP7 TaxID=619593 RepID=A0A2U9IN04_9CREN|nr:hypothetical protein [Acidianus sulfidivorans]AWR97391.1 hypothetical protein DFR86_07400 [Acidianus sulfidivorans JP7]
MINRTVVFAVSWLLWGIGYYLFQPFLSIFLVRFISANELGIFYLITQVIALPFPMIGNIISKKLGMIYTIFLGMSLSGFGMILLPFSKSFLYLIMSIALNQSFYMSLPSYYTIMRNEGENTITKVWAISVIPAIVMPAIGGFIVSIFGYFLLFIIAGICIIFSISPLFIFKIPTHINRNSIRKSKIPYMNIFAIIPLGLSSQFIYLVIKEIYSLSLESVGIIATLAEAFGMIMTFILSFINPKKALLISFSIFSFQILSLLNPYFAISFGIWEAIIPLSLEQGNSINDFTYATTMQILGWILGYAIASIISSPKESIILSSVISIFMLIFIKRKY